MESSLVRANVLFVLHLQRMLARAVRRLLFARLGQDKPLKTVLVFRTGRLGDFLNAIPALHLLRERLQGARIILATTVSAQPAMQALSASYADLSALPWLDLVVPAPVNRAIAFTMTGRSRGVTDLRRLIREESPDAVFILSNMGETLRSKLKKLVFFRLAGYRGPLFGVDGLAHRGLLRRRQFELGIYEHEVYGPIHAVSECPRIGPVEDSEFRQDVSIPESAMRSIRELIPQVWQDGRPLVAVAPGASFSHKTWPAQRFIAVGRELQREFNCRFFVVGADGDRPLGAEIEAGLGRNCLDVTGRTSVTELAALLGLCRLFVGNDSGPAHVASAVRCPCVTVTSALDYPGIWEPWNSRGRVLRTRIDCEFCLSLTGCPRGTNACIDAIKVTEVLDLCREALGAEIADRRQAASAY